MNCLMANVMFHFGSYSYWRKTYQYTHTGEKHINALILEKKHIDALILEKNILMHSYWRKTIPMHSYWIKKNISMYSYQSQIH